MAVKDPSRSSVILPAIIFLFVIGMSVTAHAAEQANTADHWAFKAPVRSSLVKLGNPIDVLVGAEWQKRGLVPQPAAGRTILLRRVYLDLTGLPPTRAEQSAFLADASADAYEKVVDRLLASPQYGERWGRHWMDIWRYSDAWGLDAEVRNSQKHMWHWRDWIVESLNANKGYDQMLREMLAADELYPADNDRLRATGFLARQYFKFNRNTWMEETVEHTSKAFLALTLNCAKCHDHKFDPIAQQDFYAFRAFFEPYQIRTDAIGAESNYEKDGLPRAFDCNLDAPTYLFIRGDEKRPKKDAAIIPAVPAFLAFDKLEIKPVQLPLEAYMPGLRQEEIDARLKACESAEASARNTVAQARQAMAQDEGLGANQFAREECTLDLAEKTLSAAVVQTSFERARTAADRAKYSQPAAGDAKELAHAAALAERGLAVADAGESIARLELQATETSGNDRAAVDKKRIAAREALSNAQKAAESPGENYTSARGSLKTLESNIETEASRNKPFPTTSTGRRSALAAWMTDARNPLTARVAVNHIWARHFGRPLVDTVFDFGRKGSPPTNQAVLDDLAVDFRESGWDMKRLHRLMVTSRVYRMTSSSAGAAAIDLSADRENLYLWRMNSSRMEAETIRDSLLSLSGDLDLTPGGPPVPITDQTSRRRSIYFVHSHNDTQKFLSTFDEASVLECYRRAESIVPQQALALENSELVMAAAGRIARKLDEKDDGDFIRAAFLLVLGDSPTENELAECRSALKEWQSLAAHDQQPNLRARVNFVHALLNHNDFVTVR